MLPIKVDLKSSGGVAEDRRGCGARARAHLRAALLRGGRAAPTRHTRERTAALPARRARSARGDRVLPRPRLLLAEIRLLLAEPRGTRQKTRWRGLVDEKVEE